jgi:hypothetical protein
MRLVVQFYSEDVDLLDKLGAGSLFLFVCAEHVDRFRLKYQCE